MPTGAGASPKASGARQSKEEKEAAKLAKASAKAEACRQKEAAKVAKASANAAAKETAQAQKDIRAAAKARAKAVAARAKLAAKQTKAAAKGVARAVAAKVPARRRRASAAEAAGDCAADPPSKRPRRGDLGEVDVEGEALLDDAAAKAEELLGGRSAVARDRAGCVARVLALERKRVAAAVRLLEEGNTVPFIARYRKELTGTLNEDELRHIERGLQRLDALENRRVRVTLALHKHGALTDELRAALLQAVALEEVADIWAPFKAKKQTRAQLAKQRGLAPLAKLIEQLGGRAAGQAPAVAAQRFVDAEKGVAAVAEALAGARDILAESYAQSGEVKHRARLSLEPQVWFAARQRPGADAEERYKTYWSFDVHMSRIKPYQFLAIQRGEAAGALRVSFELEAENCEAFGEALYNEVTGAAWTQGGQHIAWEQELRTAIADAFKRLLRPSLEREWRRRLKELAEDDAFDTYRRNLHTKLLTPPLRLHPEWGEDSAEGPVVAVLGIDPAYRTGCKMALIAGTGQVLATEVVYPHPLHSSAGLTAEQSEQAAALLHELLETGLRRRAANGTHGRLVCSIGNGTASRETESWLRQHIQDTKGLPDRVAYCIVDEAGASVYSASPLAGRELPDMDVSMRGAVSIARRLLDPMAELVKIDPQSIGVGLYQHDVDQRRLTSELQAAVSDCVNAVGVDLNTASPALLEHVAGLSASLARAVVQHRTDQGPFECRAALLQVKGVGRRAHHQAAGFLRVHGGSEPLDSTSIHPESYEIALRLKAVGLSSGQHTIAALAEEWGVGKQTLEDIAVALAGSAADPREAQPPPRIKVLGVGGRRQGRGPLDAQEAGLTVQDLAPGLHLHGIVRNVVAFGSFVDIGVGQDGLLHVSRYPSAARGRADALKVNDNIEVWIEATEHCAASAAGGGGRGGGKALGRGGQGTRGKDRWKIALTARPADGAAA